MKYKALLILGTILSALSALMFSFGLFSSIEYALSDRLFTPQAVDSRIHIIAIDNETLDTLGQWPLARETFAQVLQNIIDEKPRAIGIDVIFADPSRLGSEDDKALAEVLRGSTVPIVLPVEGVNLRIKNQTIPEADTLVKTLSEFAGNAVSYGHINLIRDRDGLVRRVPLAITYGGAVIPSFSGKVIGSTDATGIEKIVFSGRPGTIPTTPFARYADETFKPGTLRDAYVFIGATAPDLHDEQTTPVSAGTAMAGVEIQAQIANMLLLKYHLTDIPYALSLTWIVILVLIPLFSFFYIPRIGIAFLIFALLFVVNIVLVTVSFNRGYVVSIVHTTLPLLLSTFASFSFRYFILERERREIRTVFSKYVSKAVLEELLKNPSAVTLGGESAEVTVFFSDIRGFTTLSEKLTPAELTSLLNRYLTRMTDIILENGGVVDKYIGDAIMAFWGAPLKNPLHARDAVESSLAMLTALDVFNGECATRGEPSLHIGIGLNTGEVIVGNMGSTQRFDYTIMGDAVNLGSRIEGQTKTYHVRLLASEMTVASLRRSSPPIHYLIREIDKVAVKGKTQPVSLFEIVEEKRRVFVSSILTDFETLRETYYKGDWEQVIQKGAELLAKGDDGPTRVLYERAQTFLQNPPQVWTGVYELTSK